jgi:hypothetical protein
MSHVGPNIPELQVEPPQDDARRERIERAVMARLDEGAAGAAAGAVGARAPARWWWAAAAAACAAGAAIAVVLATRPPAPGSAPSLVETPPGASSRFVVDDATVDVGGDSRVEIDRGDEGATTLRLARGSIVCDVTPRAGRPPFRVVAGDVSVEVIGTRFTVEHHPGERDPVRVTVERGVVRVRSAQGERLLSASARWPEVAVAPPAPAAAAERAPPRAPEPAPPAAAAPPAPTSRRGAFLGAQRLEARDVAAAVRAYRELADGRDSWAALSLYSLAEAEAARGRVDATIAAIDEYLRRFPGGGNVEDACWLRAETLHAAGRAQAARAAARAYLDRFPDGTYADGARSIDDSR